MKLITHSGRFHADDVLCAALLDHLSPGRDLVRTRDLGFIATRGPYDIVFDVGGNHDPRCNIFDHHQKERALRSEGSYAGTPYSAFGLIWRHYGRAWIRTHGCEDAIEAEAHARFDERFVLPIDLLDNGVLDPQDIGPTSRITLGSLIESFNPDFDEPGHEASDQAFRKAMRAALPILQSVTNSVIAEIRAEVKVRAEMERQRGGEILVLQESMPFSGVLNAESGESFKLVVAPSTSAGWMVSCVRMTPNSFRNVIDLPEAWAGQDPEKLREITGVDDVIFVHPGRFCAVTESKESALRLARMTLDAIRRYEFSP